MNKNILLSFKNGIGNLILLSPTIQALKSIGYSVDILLGVEKDDPRYSAFEDIINNYDGVGFYDQKKYYDVGFYVWGEGNRKLVTDNVKDWKITKESNNLIRYFLTGKHEVKLNMTIAKHLGCEGNIPDTYCPTKEMDLSGWNKDIVNICIHIGSRPESHWKKKRWLTNYWIELIRKFTYKGYNIHTFYTGWEKDDINNIKRSLFIETNINFNLYENNSLTAIAFLIKQCDLMISTDSGPMHIANAVGTPVIQLFGPTLSSKNRAWNNNGGVVLKAQVPCSPCLYTNKFMECGDNICMKAITVDEVYINVERILDLKMEGY